MKQEINDKQEAFVKHYCTDAKFNASEAYRMAYNAKSGWNAHGAKLIAKDSITKAIEAYKAEQAVEWANSRGYITSQFKLQYDTVSGTKVDAAIRILENLGKNCGWYESDNAQKAEQSQLTADQLKDVEDFKAWKRRQYLRIS